MLRLRDLHASAAGVPILKGIDLDVAPGEVHAIMGPNGAGKSTLAQVLAGRDGYAMSGTATFKGVDLLGLAPEARAALGIFLAFQHPTEIPGVGNLYFLRTALNELRRARGLPECDARTFLGLAREHMERLSMDPALLDRSVNVGFSGGEKKRNEVLQMSVLEPDLAILDETDSGLDIDALRIVADGVQALRRADRSLLIITHHPPLLEQVVPDRVHVLADGRITRAGGPDLARELGEVGYAAAGARPAVPGAVR
jgi:Fe-S cluster assembly ATP-binding protein